MQPETNRNTIIFVVCAAVMFLAYQFFVLDPAAKRRQAELARQAPPAAATAGAPGSAPSLGAPQVPAAVTRQAAIEASPRVPIVTPSLRGSLSLKGGRIDDLYLVRYRQAVDPKSPPVELLRPEGTKFAWFAEIGWTGANVPGLPGPNTVWRLIQGSQLTPTQPVTLAYTNDQGLMFTRRLEVDDKFMITVTDIVANVSDRPITLAPYGSIQRQGVPADVGQNGIVHEGAIGALGEKAELRLVKYKKWSKDGGGPAIASTGGWVGITDKYWLAALIPDQKERIQGQFRSTKTGPVEIFDANFVGHAIAIGPGAQAHHATRLFAGAKTVPVLRSYEQQLGVPRFDDAVDWGMFWFLTRPIFSFLEWIFGHLGNFGLAILALTVVVRLIFFPLAQKQYESLTKMKKVQPQIEELRKRYKDDQQKQQQELLALYQREKVNPIAGCLPLLLQIPVFYALYKVLTVTIEMRHAPFMGWIHDLSARDPTTIWNLFGLIPYNPASVPLAGGLLDGALHLGVLPLLYGVTMWLTTSMSPPAPDPIQQKIFSFMPWIFMFIMAPFAIGLLIYWTWSNVITVLQQYVIMRRFKVDNPIDQIIRRITGKPKEIG